MIVFTHWKKQSLEICCLFITMLVLRGDRKQQDIVFVHDKLLIKLGRQGSNTFTAASSGQAHTQVKHEDLNDCTGQTLLEQFFVRVVMGSSD